MHMGLYLPTTGLGSPVEIKKLNIPSIRIMDKEFHKHRLHDKHNE